MDTSLIFTRAHQLTRTLVRKNKGVSYSATFSLCLKNVFDLFKRIDEIDEIDENEETTEMTEKEQINAVKSFLTSWAFNQRKYDQNASNLDDEAQTIIDLVRVNNLGFASDISGTVMKYKKISEKQAFHIAKAAVKKNLHSRISEIIAA